MLKLLLNSYPPEVTSAGGELSAKIPSPKTADDINDMFEELDKEEKTPPADKKDEKALKVDEKEEDKEIEEPEEEEDEIELKEPEEDVEKLDLKEEEPEIETPPRKKEILKEYPDIFKKFPFLEKIMYRDKQYNEMFGSFDDAKELAERAETFSAFENQLLEGDTKEVLRNVKEADKIAFDKIVDNYLPALAEVDKEAYYHVVGNLNKRLIMEMVEEANSTDNDDLRQAALLVNQFIFGTSKFTAPTARVAKEDPAKKSEVEEERLNFTRERFEAARDDLQSQVDNTLKATISDYIDPKGVMSGYVKKNAVADAMRILTNTIAADPTVVKNLDKLWRAAFESKFDKNDLSKIKSFYLSKAKANLKTAIMKARAEALKDLAPKREKEEEIEEKEETPRRTRTITPGRPSQPQNKSGPKEGESVTDFFMRD